MTVNFGKRDPGGLTASSPGDTLYIPFTTYNDSGASIGIGGTLAVSDIEIFKNGSATPRATDSGYSLISDTGQYGDRVGLHRFSVQLFNTSDDTGFFDAGSQYHVAIDSITVDGRTVRLFPAIFEIGAERVNVVQVDGDTGAAAHLQQAADASSNLRTDTGAVATAVWAKDARSLTSFAHDTGVSSTVWAAASRTLTSFNHDTGVSSTVWAAASRTLTAFNHDTGVAHTTWNFATRVLTANTNLDGLSVDVQQLDGDTGAATHLQQAAAAGSNLLTDTGAVATAVWAKDSRSLTAFAHDTGIASTVWGFAGRKLAVDTGIGEQVWDTLKSGHTDTGTFGEELAQGVSVEKIAGDTGAADRLLKFAGSKLASDGALDTGSGTLNVTATTDTGLVDNAEAIRAKTDSLNFTVAGQADANIQYVNDTQVAGTGDTGTNDPWGPA